MSLFTNRNKTMLGLRLTKQGLFCFYNNIESGNINSEQLGIKLQTINNKTKNILYYFQICYLWYLSKGFDFFRVGR